MGKNTASSYRKLKKIEKSKVKTKTTQTHLPKGQNVTDTNFRVKKIIIKDQVRQNEGEEILSNKKLSCKELLGRLTHSNVKIKLDSLLSLKQLITDHSEEILQSNLASLIESISRLILDESKDVRKEANKLLTLFLSQSSISRLSPLYPLMSSYLICGLTHIDTAIREDSLLFLDTLLKWIPKLCCSSKAQLLPICLDLISNTTSTSRALTLNLESRFTSSQWRGKVLERISVLLYNLLEPSKELKMHDRISSTTGVVKVFNDIPIENGKRHMPIKLSLINYDPENHQLYNAIFQVSRHDKKFNLKEFIEQLIPLMFQAVIEMIPLEETLSDKTSMIISSEVSLALKHILDILNSSWELLSPDEKDWFRHNFSKTFINSLITGRFPYSLSSNDLIKKKKKEKTCLGNDDISSNCEFQNLMLIKFILLLVGPSSWADAIACLKSYFRVSGNLSPKEYSLLIFCSERVICSRSEYSAPFLEKLNKLSRSPRSSLSYRAIATLYDIAVDPDFSSLLEYPSFQSWLDYLPELLTEPNLTPRTLDIIYDLARRNIPAFSVALDGRIEYILDKIPELCFVDDQDEEMKMKISQLLFWVKDWDDEMITRLRTGLENKYWGERVTAYLKDVFDIKFSSDSSAKV